MLLDKRSPWQDKVFDLVNLTLLCLIFLIVFYPLYFVVIASISNPEAVNRGEVLLYPIGFHLRAYETVLRDPRIMSGYRNTIFYTVAGTCLSVFVTVCAAYPLSRKELYARTFFTWFFLFTMYFNGGLIPTYLQVRNLGLVGSRLSIIVVGCLGIWNLIVCRTYFANTIPNELFEAASIDGCSVYRFFTSIVLPNAKAILAIMVLYYAVGQWNDFFRALIYLNKSELYPLSYILRDLLLSNQALMADADTALLREMTAMVESMKFAMIIIASLPVLLLYPFVQKHFVKGVMIGSLKG